MGVKKSQLGAAVGQTLAPVDLAKQSTPGTLSNKVRLYAKDVSGNAEFFIADDAGNEVQETVGGAVYSALPFGQAVSTPGTYPIEFGKINTASVAGVTFTVPAGIEGQRFGVGGTASVTVDANPEIIQSPLDFSTSTSVSIAMGPSFITYYQWAVIPGLNFWTPVGGNVKVGSVLETQNKSVQQALYARALNAASGVNLAVSSDIVTLDAASVVNPIVTVAMSPYLASFGETVICDSGTGAITIQLPPAIPPDDGKYIEVKNIPSVPAGPPVNVLPAGGGLIDGVPTFVFPAPVNDYFGVKFRPVGTAYGGAPDTWAAVLHYHVI